MSIEVARAKPWIEQVLYVECPHCEHCLMIESDHSVMLPQRDETMACEKCGESFVIEGPQK